MGKYLELHKGKIVRNNISRSGLRLLGFCALVLHFSCGNVNNGTDTLVIGVVSDAASMNPLLTRSRFDSEIAQLLFLSLMDEQPDLISFKPELARSWQVLDGGKRILFHLRTDVVWSDGVRTTARDVKFTFDKQMDPAIGWPGAAVKDRIKEVQVVDDSTVQFLFAEPYMYQLMDINDGVILPEHVLGKLTPEEWKTSSFNTDPVSNGPYRLKSWVPNQFISFTKNEKFYDSSQPHIENLIFKVVPDQTQLSIQLSTGEVQVVDGLSPSDAAAIAQKSDKVGIQHFPYGQLVQLSYNLHNPLFADKRVRQAMTLAIDRQALVDHLLSGYGQVCVSPIHPMLWAFDSKLRPTHFSPEEAKALLQQAGWQDNNGDGVLDKDKKDLAFEILTNIGSQAREDAQIMIQEMLRKVGIKAIPQRLEWSVYVEKLTARQYDAVLIGLMSATKVDPLPAWHSSMVGPDGFNLSCYQSPVVDDLIDRARLIAEPQQAMPLWAEFQERIVDDAPATFLWVPDRVVGVDKRLKGYRFSPVSTFFNVSEWHF